VVAEEGRGGVVSVGTEGAVRRRGREAGRGGMGEGGGGGIRGREAGSVFQKGGVNGGDRRRQACGERKFYSAPAPAQLS